MARELRALELDELRALATYIENNGRAWKRKLAEGWSCASGQPGPLLYALRNSHGPRWLAGASLFGEAKAFVAARGFKLDRQDEGEYRLDFDGREASASYDTDLLSICGTADHEYDRKQCRLAPDPSRIDPPARITAGPIARRVAAQITEGADPDLQTGETAHAMTRAAKPRDDIAADDNIARAAGAVAADIEAIAALMRAPRHWLVLRASIGMTDAEAHEAFPRGGWGAVLV